MGKAPFDPITKKTYHPLDTGWSWVIMSATFGLMLVLIGYQRSFGLLYVALHDSYGYSPTILSAVNGISSLTYSICTLNVMNLVLKKISVRTCALIGVVLQTAGVGGSSLCNDSPCFLLLLGFLHGMGYAMVHSPSILIVSQYFENYRYIATAIATSGVSVGAIIFPFITRFLLDNFGLKGTLLLLGGIILQQCIFVALFQPIIREPQQEQQQRNLDGKAECVLSIVRSQELISIYGSQHFVFLPPEIDNEVNHDTEKDDNEDIIIVNGLHERTTRNDDHMLSKNNCRNSAEIRTLIGEKSYKSSLQEEPTRCSKIPQILRMHSFWLVALYNIGAIISAAVPAVYIPPLAQERGLSLNDGAFFLTISGGTDFLGRILAGLILHFKLTKPCQLAVITGIALGILFNLTPLFNDFYSLLIFSLFYGLFSSTVFAIQSLVLIEVLGLGNLRAALGYVAVITGTTTGASYPFAGMLSDKTGSYTTSFHFFGAASILSAIALSFILLPQYRLRWKEMSSTSSREKSG